jgi:pseudouridylate synthase
MKINKDKFKHSNTNQTFGGQQRKSFNPNFSKNNTLNRGRKPSYDHTADGNNADNRDEKRKTPFENTRKPFNSDRKPFERDRKPFERDRRPFSSDRKPFNSERKPRQTGDNRSYTPRDSRKRDYAEAPRNLYSAGNSRQARYSADFMDMSKPMRLNRFLANSNICSRREADDFITSGVVSVNGQIVTTLGTKIVPAQDKVYFHNEPVSLEKKVYILLNKPKNIITTSDDPKDRKTVLDLINGACQQRVYPVGRLDRNTTGVILITNDGELTTRLTHPKHLFKKIYHVGLDKDLEDSDMQKLKDGIVLEDGEAKADDVSYVKDDSKKQVGIEVHSGRNRIVRRMFEHLGYKVVNLDRVYFAGLTKKNLPRGKWRFLSEREVSFLKMNSQ